MKLIKNIAIVVLIIYILLQWFNPGGIMPGGRIIRIEGKRYEVIKHKIDTVNIIKREVVTKNGADIYHEIIIEKKVVIPTIVDTAFLLKDYYAKFIYKDTLILADSLGKITIMDTITQNKIWSRTFIANVNSKVIRETTVVNKPIQPQIYWGLNGGFNKSDIVSFIGTGVMLKTKQDKIYQLNLGVMNNVVENKLMPVVGFGTYWKIKLKK
jgi:hypothetical protein